MTSSIYSSWNNEHDWVCNETITGVMSKTMIMIVKSWKHEQMWQNIALIWRTIVNIVLIN